MGEKIMHGFPSRMEVERARAAQMGYPSPIQPDKEATDRDYDAAIHYLLDNEDTIDFMAATHNRESTALLARLLQERGLKEKAANVYFAQLYGMSDNLTYNLADAGYHVVKYVPYGAVKTMMLAKYLKKKFFPELQKIHYNSLKKRHKGKLDCTNNQIENYIGNTMPQPPLR